MDVFFILIPNLLESVDKYQSSNRLNKDSVGMKNCKMLPFINIQVCSAFTCSVEWLHLQIFKTYRSLFKWLDLCYLTDSFKLGIKMKKTSCFPWYAFNSPDRKHFCENWTYRSVQENFLLSVYCLLQGVRFKRRQMTCLQILIRSFHKV